MQQLCFFLTGHIFFLLCLDLLIKFVVISGDLRVSWTELSPYSYLLVSWICWWGRRQGRLGSLKCTKGILKPPSGRSLTPTSGGGGLQTGTEAGQVLWVWLHHVLHLYCLYCCSDLRSQGLLRWQSPNSGGHGSKGCRQAEEGDLPHRGSGKPSGASEGESSVLQALFSVQVEGFWLWLGTCLTG